MIVEVYNVNDKLDKVIENTVRRVKAEYFMLRVTERMKKLIISHTKLGVAADEFREMV